MSSLKLMFMMLFYWETGEKEFGCLILLIIFLVVSGVELYLSVGEMSGLMFLLGLLGGMAVLMSFMLKLCSPSKVEMSVPSFCAFMSFIFISTVTSLVFTLNSWDELKDLSSINSVNLLTIMDSSLACSSQLVIISILITLLMSMLLVVESILCQKQKGLL
uniref:NADH dehydrogenase subunit 6 n=1 Tax=Hoplopleura kitti TaxID=1511644 RepID=A0A075ECM1_9NEOP|nr:NADH dehydrogenase subunit 6 [Hoplopleura kitti]